MQTGMGKKLLQVGKTGLRWRGSKDPFAVQGWRNYLL